jgi:hypothetical protein
MLAVRTVLVVKRTCRSFDSAERHVRGLVRSCAASATARKSLDSVQAYPKSELLAQAL